MASCSFDSMRRRESQPSFGAMLSWMLIVRTFGAEATIAATSASLRSSSSCSHRTLQGGREKAEQRRR